MNGVIVTGVTGFIGGSLARHFADRGLAVTGLVKAAHEGLPFATRATSWAEDELASLIRDLDPGVIIHAAGSASVGASISNPAHDFASQVLLFQRLLEGVRRSGRKPRVVLVSSAAVYGNPDKLPVAEDARLAPISPYGHHKVMAEQLAREYAECFGVPTLVIRLFSLFGPAQRRLLLWELFEQFRDRPQVIVEGTGDEARDYLHINDLAQAVLRLLEKIDAPTSTVNVASGQCITVRELASKIGAVLQTDKQVIFRGKSLPGNPTRWQADVSRYHQLVGAPAASDFDERLAWNLRQWLS